MSEPVAAPESQVPRVDPADKSMEELVSLCKRRGFVYPASEVYGGLNGFWDYGPLGIELKNAIRDWWWRCNVQCPPIGPDGEPIQMVGLDSSIIQNPKTWVASGHVGGFSDPMVDCTESKKRYRADHLWVFAAGKGRVVTVGSAEQEAREAAGKRAKKLGGLADEPGTSFLELDGAGRGAVLGPDATKPGTLTEPREFNLMFETFVGAIRNDDAKAYLRPETAQGIF
ncbi:MAG: glycine--tRNA ligase, partial [Planctomycetota bacterium]